MHRYHFFQKESDTNTFITCILIAFIIFKNTGLRNQIMFFKI